MNPLVDEKKPGRYEDDSPLGPYLNTPVKLFIADPQLLKQTARAMAGLGFGDISIVNVKPNYFKAMRQLFGEVKNHEGIVLVNHPPQLLKDADGVSYHDFTFADFYKGVASFNKSTLHSSTDYLSRCVPILTSAQDHDIRLRIVEQLFSFGIVGVFFLRIQEMYGSPAEQFDERLHELHDYLLEYFCQRNRKLKDFKEYKSAEELRERRQLAEEMMKEVEGLKAAKEFDKAVALCRRVIEILPTDPEAYLEGGRLLVKKKKYPPALQMFQDAEKVAEQLPAPSQEIGNVRVLQVKDYIARQKASNKPVDPKKLDEYLSEAAEAFEAALQKAATIPALLSEDQKAKRKDAQAAIAENILTLDLGPELTQTSDMAARLNQLAQDALVNQVRGDDEELDPKYLVQFGLMSFNAGDYDKAEEYMLQAARREETFEDACRRLNYMGTQFRMRGLLDRAVETYRTLKELRPPFMGVVIFNLAVALMSQSLEEKKNDPARAGELENESLGTAVQALYVDPALASDENFYANTIMAAPLKKTVQAFENAARELELRRAQGPFGEESRLLEELIAKQDDRQALQVLFRLAQTKPKYFMEFNRHATPGVVSLATRLRPLLLKKTQPRMQTFGKILGVLLKKAHQSGPGAEVFKNPYLKKVMQALEKADQSMAAMEMARALLLSPDLVDDPDFTTDVSIPNLCAEVLNKLSNLNFSRFKSAPS